VQEGRFVADEPALLPWHTYLAGPTSWDARLTGVRAGAAARRVLAVLHQYPVLDAATLAHALGVSDRASRTAWSR